MKCLICEKIVRTRFSTKEIIDLLYETGRVRVTFEPMGDKIICYVCGKKIRDAFRSKFLWAETLTKEKAQ